MSRSSRRNAAQAGRRRTRPELIGKLQEQYDSLVALADAFDRGSPTVAYQMAVTIRVLAHESKSSRSLLGQLEVRDSLLFMDTADHIDPRNLLPAVGLPMMMMKVDPGHPSEAIWTAPLGNLPPPRQHPPIPFGPWWTNPLAKAPSGKTWSRFDFIDFLANKEGGAHVVPSISDEELYGVETDNSMGWTVSDDPFAEEEGRPMSNGPIPASIRQITYEVVETIRPWLDSGASE